VSWEDTRRGRTDLTIGRGPLPQGGLFSARERRRADLFWADLQRGVTLGPGISGPRPGEGEDEEREPDRERDDHPGFLHERGPQPFLGDGPGDTWRVIARPGTSLGTTDLRGDDLILRHRHSLIGHHQSWVAVTVDDADEHTMKRVTGRVRADTVVLRRVHGPERNRARIGERNGSRDGWGDRQSWRDGANGRAGWRGRERDYEQGDEQEDEPPGAAPARYGGYLLRRGDDDATQTWGGRRRAASEPQPAAGAPGFVRQLQQDLRTLGFALVGTPDGRFNRSTEWAVREFQHVADGPWVAQEQAAAAGAPARYVDRLTAVQMPASSLTPSTVCGWLSANDRARIELWLQNRWRCPVVVEAWRSADLDAGGQPLAGRAPLEENLWLHSQPANRTSRVLARDFSRAYDVTALGRNRDALRVLGYREASGKGGPQSVPPNNTWSEAEITPLSMTGRAIGALTPEELSTFKVIRAVSETECEGYLDGLNCWDNVILSAGPYHWPIGAPNWSAGEPGWNEGGELGGFLAYLRDRYPDAHLRLTRGAVQAEKRWNPADATFFNSSQRRYASRLQWRTFEHDGGFVTVPLTPEDMSYFKTWRWVYRFEMAARTDPEYRRAMWDYARIRIRDLLATPWGAGLQVGAGAAGRPATMADVFQSELNVAMVLRWHVRFPAHVVSGGRAGAVIRGVVTGAGVAGTDVATWGDREEALIAAAIMASPRVPDTMSTVHDWPTWTTAPARNPRRYALDLSSLPAAERRLRVNRGSYRLSAP
jgi:hypothetical protein